MITMLFNTKESLVQNARRAMKNAEANGKVVTLKGELGSVLVYPGDNLGGLLKHLKVMELKHGIQKLQEKIA